MIGSKRTRAARVALAQARTQLRLAERSRCDGYRAHKVRAAIEQVEWALVQLALTVTP